MALQAIDQLLELGLLPRDRARRTGDHVIHAELLQPTRPGLGRRSRREAAATDFEADLGCVCTVMP